MTEPRNWLIDILEDASQKVEATPSWRRSAYWDAEYRKIEERKKNELQARTASKEADKDKSR